MEQAEIIDMFGTYQGAAPGGRLDPWGHPLAPFGLYLYLFPKPSRTKPFLRTRLCSATAAIPRWGCQKTLSRHPVEGRIDLRELLHHHGRFPDEP